MRMSSNDIDELIDSRYATPLISHFCRRHATVGQINASPSIEIPLLYIFAHICCSSISRFCHYHAVVLMLLYYYYTPYYIDFASAIMFMRVEQRWAFASRTQPCRRTDYILFCISSFSIYELEQNVPPRQTFSPYYIHEFAMRYGRADDILSSLLIYKISLPSDFDRPLSPALPTIQNTAQRVTLAYFSLSMQRSSASLILWEMIYWYRATPCRAAARCHILLNGLRWHAR